MSLTKLPQINAPTDERQVVETYARLINPGTWKNKGGTSNAYLGMIAVVTNNVADEKRNGVYHLVTLPVSEGSWIKIGSDGEHNDLEGRDEEDCHPMSAITGLEEAIENIELTPGPQGKSGVYLGVDEPDDEEEAKVWINPEGIASEALAEMQKEIDALTIRVKTLEGEGVG